MNNLYFSEKAEKIVSVLHQKGYKAFFVGGAVRDAILRSRPSDIDIATSAKPVEVIDIFVNTVPTGEKHGTVTVIFEGDSFEVTTFRTESGYSDLRRPDTVNFVSDITQDLARRDFTINAIAYNSDEGFVDPFDGITDIKRRLIKAVGNAENRFSEDALRILRCVRFSAELGFEIEKQTFLSAKKMSHNLLKISAERKYSEIIKFFKSANQKNLIEAEEIGIFEYCFGITLDLSDIKKCAERESLYARLAIILKNDATRILERLKSDKHTIRAVNELICFSGEIANPKIAAAGLKYADFFDLCDFLNQKDKLIELKESKRNGEPCSFNELSLKGEDLLQLGFKGKEVGVLMDKIFLHVMNVPEDNKKDVLIKLTDGWREDNCN